MNRLGASAPLQPLRVLIVIENVSLARDHRTRKQVETLVDAGYEVAVVSRRDADNRRYSGLGARIFEYPAPRDAATKLGFLWEYGYSLVAAFVLCIRAALTMGFDVMQVGNPPDAQYLLAVPFRWFGRALIVDQRDVSTEVYADRFGRGRGLLWTVLRTVEVSAWRSADHIITVNETLAATIAERSCCPRDRVTIVGNGPRANRSGVPIEELRARGRFVVVWLGLMGPQDHADLALRAASYVCAVRNRDDCQFVFIGDGEELLALQALSRELGLDEYTTFTGWLPEERLVDYLATADLGIDTNLQEDVTPVKGLEYMSFGVPMVAFDLEETRRMAGGAGRLVPPGDTQQLGEAIIALLDDRARSAAMGVAGLQRIDEALGWERQAQRYLASFDALPPHSSRPVRWARSAQANVAECLSRAQSQQGGVRN